MFVVQNVVIKSKTSFILQDFKPFQNKKSTLPFQVYKNLCGRVL
jgi:hypothetical protein